MKVFAGNGCRVKAVGNDLRAPKYTVTFPPSGIVDTFVSAGQSSETRHVHACWILKSRNELFVIKNKYCAVAVIHRWDNGIRIDGCSTVAEAKDQMVWGTDTYISRVLSSNVFIDVAEVAAFMTWELSLKMIYDPAHMDLSKHTNCCVFPPRIALSTGLSMKTIVSVTQSLPLSDFPKYKLVCAKMLELLAREASYFKRQAAKKSGSSGAAARCQCGALAAATCDNSMCKSCCPGCSRHTV
ncbi:hypothetical protein DIPPA_34331 [Diplonema papillatum]|nr:hypothetical protein DIPPA_34331 [Diplonema papillatum]